MFASISCSTHFLLLQLLQPHKSITHNNRYPQPSICFIATETSRLLQTKQKHLSYRNPPPCCCCCSSNGRALTDRAPPTHAPVIELQKPVALLMLLLLLPNGSSVQQHLWRAFGSPLRHSGTTPNSTALFPAGARVCMVLGVLGV